MTRVQRRQRLAGAVVVGAAAAFIWTGAPEAIAAAGAHLSLADVVVLLLVAAAGFAALFVSVLLLLGDALKAHARGRARLDAYAAREAHRAPAPAARPTFPGEPAAGGPVFSPARLALTTKGQAS